MHIGGIVLPLSMIGPHTVVARNFNSIQAVPGSLSKLFNNLAGHIRLCTSSPGVKSEGNAINSTLLGLRRATCHVERSRRDSVDNGVELPSLSLLTVNFNAGFLAGKLTGNAGIDEEHNRKEQVPSRQNHRRQVSSVPISTAKNRYGMELEHSNILPSPF